MKRVPRPGRPRKPRPNHWGWRHQQLAKELKAKGGGCAWVYRGGCRGPLQADHIIPAWIGGLAVLENYQLLCRRHNLVKRDEDRKRFGRAS